MSEYLKINFDRTKITDDDLDFLIEGFRETIDNWIEGRDVSIDELKITQQLVEEILDKCCATIN